MLKITVRQKTIIPTRETGEVALGPLEFILSNKFTTNSAKTYLSAIGHIEDLCEFFEIEDYEARLSYGEGLHRDELIDINLGLQYRADDLKQLLEAKRAGASVDLLFSRWETGRQPKTGVVARKKRVARQYFSKLMENGDKCLRNHVIPSSMTETRRDAYQSIFEVIDPPKVDRKRDGVKAALEDLSNLESFMVKYEPNAIWKSEEVALRNSVMFDLQFWCGLRIGEVLSLQLTDMKSRAEFISVVDRRYSEDDPRGAYAPAVKTYERPVWVPKFLWEKLSRWREVKLDIDEELWDLGLRGRQNEYLFVSLDRRQKSFGMPVSGSTASKAFDQVMEAAHVEIEGGSHLLRHLAAMRFVRMRKKSKNRDDIIEDLKTSFGWSPKSTMPSYYTSHEVTRQNNEMMKKHDAEYLQRMRNRELNADQEHLLTEKD